MSGVRQRLRRSRLRARPASWEPASGAATAGAAAGYTIAHAGRQIRLGPVAFWIFVGTVVIMAGWSVATATYFAFRDDLLKGLIARQAEQQYAYEDRIAELRARIDRTTSRQLLDQEQFEQKLDDLMRRADDARSRARLRSARAPAIRRRPARPAANRQMPSSPATSASAAIGARPSSLTLPATRKAGKEGDIGGRLSRIEASLDRVERREARALAQMQERYDGKTRKLRSVLAELGLKLDAPRRLRRPAARSFPSSCQAKATVSSAQLTRVNIARAQADRLSRTLVRVPLRKPVTGEIDLSSTFGVRIDPFLHIPAMQPGSISAAMPATRSTPPRPARSPMPAGAAATARWSRSITATAFQPATATCRRSTSRSATTSASARSSAAWARPGARPARICTTRPASTARRSIRRSSFMPVPNSWRKRIAQ